MIIIYFDIYLIPRVNLTNINSSKLKHQVESRNESGSSCSGEKVEAYKVDKHVGESSKHQADAVRVVMADKVV